MQATAAYTIALNAANLREFEELRKIKEDRFLLTMLQERLSGEIAAIHAAALEILSGQQGTAPQAGGLGVVFGDGLWCATGTLVRLAVKTNVGGASAFPGTGDPSVSVQGLVTAGSTRLDSANFQFQTGSVAARPLLSTDPSARTSMGSPSEVPVP